VSRLFRLDLPLNVLAVSELRLRASRAEDQHLVASVVGVTEVRPPTALVLSRDAAALDALETVRVDGRGLAHVASNATSACEIFTAIFASGMMEARLVRYPEASRCMDAWSSS
jgi:hypothetical protein